MAPLDISFSGVIISRVVSRELLASCFARLGLGLLGGSWGLRRGCSFKESGALGKDGLESIDIFLNTRPGVCGGEFDPGESAAIGAEIPARNQIARRWLVVDLGRSGKREVKLRRQVKVQVEVLLAIRATA
jgi:hypothetical protein